MARVGVDAARALLCGDVPGRADAAFRAALALAAHTAHSGLGRLLADALSGDEHSEIARVLDGRVPKETVSLRELAVWVDEILLASLGEDGDLQERVRRTNNLANRYSMLGMREQALVAAQRAVQISEELRQSVQVLAWLTWPGVGEPWHQVQRAGEAGRSAGSHGTSGEAI